jgi:hypothetical protein
MLDIAEYLPAYAVTLLALASYLLFYTAYSKMNKTLELELLVKVLTVSEGLEHTLIEMNKAISLAGLTVLALAFGPGFDSMRWELLWHAMVLLWSHSCYSAFQFYGGTHIPKIGSFPYMLTDLGSADAKQRVGGCYPSTARCPGKRVSHLTLGLLCALHCAGGGYEEALHSPGHSWTVGALRGLLGVYICQSTVRVFDFPTPPLLRGTHPHPLPTPNPKLRWRPGGGVGSRAQLLLAAAAG